MQNKYITLPTLERLPKTYDVNVWGFHFKSGFCITNEMMLDLGKKHLILRDYSDRVEYRSSVTSKRWYMLKSLLAPIRKIYYSSGSK